MLLLGDSLEKLKTLESNSIDAVVTDPPYGLAFMGKKWDYDVPSVELWREVLRVLKPGGHLLSFGGTRTYHRMVVNIEDAGFEIRDQIQWLYGSGFPKSYNVSKGIDKKFGHKRPLVQRTEFDGTVRKNDCKKGWKNSSDNSLTSSKVALTDDAKQWDGWGTALKPANEPIVVARKPLSEKNIVDNVLKWGTGAINVDGCRVETSDNLNGGAYSNGEVSGLYNFGLKRLPGDFKQPQGRFPANIILDEVAAEMLDEQSGILKQGGAQRGSVIKSKGGGYGADALGKVEKQSGQIGEPPGGASRFFYVAKASKRERNAGLEGMPVKFTATMNDGIGKREHNENQKSAYNQNHHPTVKPVKLMEYLIKLVTPPQGTVLDPFMGSGTTGVAAKNLGFNFVGIERESEYYEIASRRIGVKESQEAPQLSLSL